MKPQIVPMAEAIRIVTDELAAAAAEAGPVSEAPSDWLGWRKRHIAAMDALAERLARKLDALIDDTGASGTRVRINGLESRSTAGLSSAIGNWLIAARKREAQP